MTRFSKDLTILDLQLNYITIYFISGICKAISSIIVVTITLPEMLIPILIVLLYSIYIFKKCFRACNAC